MSPVAFASRVGNRMTSTIFTIDSMATRTRTALVVEPSAADAVWIALVLSELGFSVTVSDTFQDARAQLTVPPALLVTELRLGEYNGLHLVLRGKSAHPELAAIVTSRIDDPVLYAEAEQLGATYVLKNVGAQEFRAAILRTLFQSDPPEGSIRPPFERRTSDRRRHVDPIHEPELRVAERRRDVSSLIARHTSRES
jgi:two-component system response regulator RegA